MFGWMTFCGWLVGCRGRVRFVEGLCQGEVLLSVVWMKVCEWVVSFLAGVGWMEFGGLR